MVEPCRRRGPERAATPSGRRPAPRGGAGRQAAPRGPLHRAGGRARGAGRAGGAPWSGSAGRCARGCGPARGWRRRARPRRSGRRRWWACRGASGCTRSPRAGGSTGTASGSAWSRCRGSARGRGARVTRPPGTCLRAPSKFAQVAAAATPLVLKVGWAALAHTLQHSGKHTSLAH